MMGSDHGSDDEQPVHEVAIVGFDMMETEVTVAAVEGCARAGACGEEHWRLSSFDRDCNFGNPGRGDHPMNCVDWYGAAEFCRWIGGRLPTEAEWEYAARSEGSNREYPWGDETATCELAVMYGEGDNGCGQDSTWPACSKPLGNTDQGICDMAGNVFEWVEDGYHANYVGAPTDGSAWGSGTGINVVRGGAWSFWSFDDASSLRASSLLFYSPSNRYKFFGFRCARASR